MSSIASGDPPHLSSPRYTCRRPESSRSSLIYRPAKRLARILTAEIAESAEDEKEKREKRKRGNALSRRYFPGWAARFLCSLFFILHAPVSVSTHHIANGRFLRMPRGILSAEACDPSSHRTHPQRAVRYSLLATGYWLQAAWRRPQDAAKRPLGDSCNWAGPPVR